MRLFQAADTTREVLATDASPANSTPPFPAITVAVIDAATAVRPPIVGGASADNAAHTYSARAQPPGYRSIAIFSARPGPGFTSQRHQAASRLAGGWWSGKLLQEVAQVDGVLLLGGQNLLEHPPGGRCHRRRASR